MLKKITATALSLCLLFMAIPALAEDSKAEAPAQKAPFGVFKAENILGGAPVTEAYFAEAELTLVNYWATWCGPCRTEMPDLAALGELTEGRAQVLGVLTDGLVDVTGKKDMLAIEDAQFIMEEAGVEFPVVLPDTWLMQISTIVTGLPTTFLVDTHGNVLSYVVGMRTADQWVDIVQDALGNEK